MDNNSPIRIAQSDFTLFTDRAFDGMLKIVEELGDDLANRRPDLPETNSPYAIVAHCIGVANHWLSNSIAGRAIPRDRDSEFRAAWSLEELRQQVSECRGRIAKDLSSVDGLAPLESPDLSRYAPAGGPRHWTQGAAVMHLFEELAQHHGQLELTRDLLTSGSKQRRGRPDS